MYDGALQYFFLAGQEFFNSVFVVQLIGRGRPITWLARSPDLNSKDFYFGGRLSLLFMLQKSVM
jgi:hypothetical protein